MSQWQLNAEEGHCDGRRSTISLTRLQLYFSGQSRNISHTS